MDLGSIFLILALTVVVGLFVARPFLTRDVESAPDAREHDLSSLLAERDRLLNALQELDFDNGLGKIPAEDYPAQRALLLQQAAAVLRRLDGLQGADRGGTAEERVERVVAARRADAAVAMVGGPGSVRSGAAADEVEELIMQRKKQRQEKSGGFCPKCGKPVQKSDRFCSVCGTVIK
ncbi:MAG: zinc ribbon domain-containing protein [Anaerolineae bacterium]|nr:zinc ribbon domain-containing protein [Anaerolineae bacterium]